MACTIALTVLDAPHAPRRASAATSLRADAKKIGFDIGGEVGSVARWAHEYNDTALRELSCREFSTLTPGNAMKFGPIHPRHTPLVSTPNDYAFTHADKLVTEAMRCKQRVIGHGLVFHDQLPAWLTSKARTQKNLKVILKDHVQTVVRHFAGRVYAWQVVNQPADEDNWWRDRLGDGYVDLAFKWARQADPTAKLYIGEWGAEAVNAKSEGLYARVASMRSRGVPIDGVAFQYHWGQPGWGPVYPDPVSVVENFRRFAALGLETMISELDVPVTVPPDQAKFAAQAEIYHDAVGACLAPGTGCRMVTVWGIADRYWWQNGADQCCGLLFDKNLARKAAYHRVSDAIRGL